MIAGPNGSGKNTLAVICVALSEPEKNILCVAGRVASGDYNVPDEDVRRRLWQL